METPKPTLSESIRVILQNKVQELYFETEGIAESDIETLVTEITEQVLLTHIPREDVDFWSI
jgi:hypothetical protein